MKRWQLLIISILIVTFVFYLQIFYPIKSPCEEKLINITAKDFAYKTDIYIYTNETIYKLRNPEQYYDIKLGVSSHYICNDTIRR